jgi:hypothetical protein
VRGEKATHTLLWCGDALSAPKGSRARSLLVVRSGEASKRWG